MPEVEKRTLRNWEMAALRLDWIASARLAYWDHQSRYIEMADEFRRIVAARPWISQCIVAREIGARAFGIATPDILRDDRRPELAEKRQKIMAFTRVITRAGVNQIARHFNRDHSAVAHACTKYEAMIRAAIRAGNTSE